MHTRLMGGTSVVLLTVLGVGVTHNCAVIHGRGGHAVTVARHDIDIRP